MACLHAALRDPLAELVFWLPESETYATPRASSSRRCPTTAARTRRSRARAREPRCSCTTRRCSSGARLSATSSPQPHSRSRSRAFGSRSGFSSRRCRLRACASSRPDYEERRRLERDLHDGAQQRLVSLGLQIRRMQRSLPREASILAPALDQIVGEVARRSAICVRSPPACAQPASTTASRRRCTTSLARRPSRSRSRRRSGVSPPSVEAAAYFVVCEALTNAVKHASASHVGCAQSRERHAAPEHRRRRRRRRPRTARLRPGRTRRSRLGARRHPRHRQPARRRHTHRGGHPVQLVIAEDTVLLREGLAGLLEDAGHAWSRASATPKHCSRWWPSTSPSSRSSTCACRRPTRTRAWWPPPRSAARTRARRCSYCHSTSRAVTPSRWSAPAEASATC